MRERGEGRIVNVASVLAHTTGALTGWYQASKHALSAINDTLRVEVAAFGVEVVQIEPGGFTTNIWRKAEDDMLRRRPDSPYGTAYDRALAILRALKGRMPPPAVVAEVIGGALTAGRPKTRYRVGIDATALRWANALVPERLKDRAVRAILAI